MRGPYRTAPDHQRKVVRPTRSDPDAELVWVFGLVWAVSAAHVVTAIGEERPFATSETAAAALMVALPLLLRAPLAALFFAGRAPRAR